MDLAIPEIRRRTVIIAGGGTGGHIYPGVAIARALIRHHPNIDVVFVGARGGLEEKIVPREGFALRLVEVGKLHKSVGLAERAKTLLKLPRAFFASAAILRELRPVAVLGVGGYASGPLVFVAALFGYRALIWEPNAYPGLANRLLARIVAECLLVFSEAASHLRARRVTQSGLPVRSSMRPREASEGRADGPLRVLVFGGSQGARAVNLAVSQAVVEGGDWLDGVEVAHQTGAADWSRVRDAYAGLPATTRASVQAFEYLHDMDARYRWADLVVCRSGASTVAEICACQKAAVFVPLPTAADDHQRKNAEALAKSGAAELVLQTDFTAARFKEIVRRYRDDREAVGRLEAKVRQFQFPNAAEKIVARVLGEESLK
jgi:UDP-N-acetylglucosamine--N-acetylmuramyl-(pentapeptide) pyrophosphoryl-undecaprenol N-acetylglucosamine transferase